MPTDDFPPRVGRAIELAFRDDAPSPPAAEVPSVMLATPYYGLVSMGWAGGYYGASRRPEMLRIAFGIQASSSVLPSAFNDLLAKALDARDQGEVTHLAMVHADVAPEPGWLDVLYGELWTHGADLVSAVVPIKAPGGRTSTAIGNAADRWDIKRCIHMHERESLPDTFGPEHVCGDGEVLLVNTGCWIADLRRPWWDDITFRFHHRIIRHEDGRREVQQRTEDWEMSFDLHEAGAKVMATWKVKLVHEGGGKWPNY